MTVLILAVLISACTLAIAAFSLLPFTESQQWWIQAMEFPRIHYVFVLLPLIALTLVLMPRGWWALVAVQLACLGYQGWKIYPYTPLAKREIDYARPEPHHDVVRVMSSNVLMENDRYQAVRDAITGADPDILFLMETDETWASELDPVVQEYPTVLRHPKDNYYGLVLATRLKVHKMEVRYLTADDTPTAFAELETDTGKVFRFVGMHPRPPTPGVDSEDRDAQLYYAARFARATGMPVIIMGDFNAVAWSNISHRFKQVGRYLDPRIGRGPLPSFDVNHPILRFPIDQIYITDDVAMVHFGRGPDVGSDHYPMIADLILDPDVARGLNRETLPLAESREEAIAAMVEQHAERLRHAHAPRDATAEASRSE
ncbi:endonuclease/exonuclease/phosphatase family protein [Oceaniglobus roseus]|uniref:endonuclease/exonuclease/phosphatase family protein n=1 Tax=Oceaniglobus roseus TaxID=1737570 RepID=UPI000C7F6E97|nr:endonuclease/exonuclease/phosphatase family protein [Kandeliimicrobium roseum]